MEKLRATRLRLVIAAGALAVAATAPRTSAAPGFAPMPRPTTDESASRIVHRFDFREQDNYDALPRGWIRFPDADFADPAMPRYTEGRFDLEVGHDAAPSFRLDAKGRSVAFRYVGQATRIRPGDYLVVGYVRPDQLSGSRAVLSAYYLDWHGNPLPGTQRFSNLAGGADAAWQRLQVYLPEAPVEAHFIGITCWVVQEEIWRGGPSPHRYIGLRDTGGGAWFDDIVVLGLPRAELSTRKPGNVIEPPDVPSLFVNVADEERAGLAAMLRVTDDAGGEVFASAAPVKRYDDEAPAEFALRGLAPGLYHARLEVTSLGEPLLERTLTFAALAPRRRGRGVISREMGAVVPEARPEAADDVIALIRTLGVGMVKLPIWTDDPARPSFDVHREALHHVLDQLIESRISVSATLSGPPTAMRQAARTEMRTLLDVLADDPRGWENSLDAVAAPYASIFQSWQIGPDRVAALADDSRLPAALNAVRTALRKMTTAPNLTTVASLGAMPDTQRMHVDNLTVVLPRDIQPAYIAAHLAPYKALGYDRLWVSAPAPDPAGYDSQAALAAWTRTLIETRWAGVDTVFVPALWKSRTMLGGSITEPDSAYIVFRTLVDTLADLRPVQRLDLDGGVEGLVFGNGRRAVFILWDPGAPPEGAIQTLQIGDANEAFDVWGRPVEVRTVTDGRRELRVGRLPIFVPDVEQWLLQLRAALSIAPQQMGFSFEPRQHVVTLTNPADGALSGEITLEAPPQWEIAPARLRFSLRPSESRDFPIEVHYPYSEPAGDKFIRARLEVQAAQSYVLDIPLKVELRLPDVDVWGFAVSEGDRLVVRHGVTNRSSVPLSFQSFAVFPGRSRQYRVINELLPGQTTTAEYRFDDAAGATGRSVRLGLREVAGPRIHNLEVIVP